MRRAGSWMVLVVLAAWLLPMSVASDAHARQTDETEDTDSAIEQQDAWYNYDSFGEYDVSIRDAERLIELLGLDADQSQSVRDLLEAHRVKTDSAREKMTDFNRKVYGSQGHEQLPEEKAKRVAEVQKKYTEYRQRQRDAVIDDIRAILTDAQSERWSKVDRWLFRRKQSNRGWGRTSLPHFDLTDFVGGIYASTPVPEALKSRLEVYEDDLYRALKACEVEDRRREEEFNMAEWTKMSVEQRQQRNDQQRRESVQRARVFRELNLKAFNSVLGAVDDEPMRLKMEEAFYRQVATSYYESGTVAKSLGEADRLGTLTGEQKTRLEALKRSISLRAIGRGKESLARAIAKEDEFAAGTISMEQFYDREDDWNEEAFLVAQSWEQARVEELRAILTAEQIESMSPPVKRASVPALDFDE